MLTTEAMTPRERWLAAINFQPVDRLPFWPKLDAAYPRAQAGPFRKLPIAAIHDWIGSDRHVWLGACVNQARAITSVEESTKGMHRTTVYRTPFGDTQMVKQFDVASQAWHPIAFPVKDLKTVKMMTAFYEDTSVALDQDALRRITKQVNSIGQGALTVTNIGESPLMFFVEWLAGIENAHYLLADHRQEVETLFEAIHQVMGKTTELLAQHSPTDALYFTENTSTTLISPEQYRRYCYPHITAYGEITRRYGRVLILHMCGKLKRLLPDLATLPAEAFEAFTAPPLGDTRLIDGRTACPEKCLIGSTHAMLWTRPASEITAQVEQYLDELPHHRGLVVTSAGVMPPLCKPETIKAVCEWVKTYSPSM